MMQIGMNETKLLINQSINQSIFIYIYIFFNLTIYKNDFQVSFLFFFAPSSLFSLWKKIKKGQSPTVKTFQLIEATLRPKRKLLQACRHKKQFARSVSREKIYDENNDNMLGESPSISSYQFQAGSIMSLPTLRGEHNTTTRL